MSELEVDAAHLLPPEEWAEVVAQAAVEAERIAAGHPLTPPSLRGTVFEGPRGDLAELAVELEPHRFGTGVAAPLAGVVSAPSNGGRRAGGGPTFGVIHTAETPLTAGYAASIARYFGRGPGTSCHYMTDPAEAWGVLPDELIAWHVGNGNPNSIGLEQAGYASLPRAAWLGDLGYAQMRRNATIMRGARDRYGIGLYAMTDAQLLAAHRRQIVGGWATHDQCRRVLGGTTHTDPGNFPVDVQMQLANGDDDMPLTDADVVKIMNWPFVELDNGRVVSFGEVVKSMDANVGALRDAVAGLAARDSGSADPAAIAAALAPALRAEVSGGETVKVDQAQLEAALRNVLGSLG